MMDFIKSSILKVPVCDENLEMKCKLYNLINDSILPVIKLSLEVRIRKNENVSDQIKDYKEYCQIRDTLFDNIIHISKENYDITY